MRGTEWMKNFRSSAGKSCDFKSCDFHSQTQPNPRKNKIMKTLSVSECRMLAGLASAGAALIAATCLVTTAQAGPAPAVEAITPAPAPTWKWGVSADYMYRDVDREEDYLSPGEFADEMWNVDYDDFDGDLWGFTAFVIPPCFFDIMFDFSYRTGDLEGDFENYSLVPNSAFGGPFEGEADFDRDEYVIGITIPCPVQDWLFARLEYFNFQEDGDWNYDDGDVESQEYTLWGVSAGVGAKQSYPLGGGGAMLDLNAFLGLVYFDFEHEEKASGAETDWNDWGFLGRVGARVSYPIQSQLDVFLGCGYEYLQTDDGDLEMTNQGLFVNLGLKGEF